MTMKLCLLVPLNVGEEARQLLIEQDVLDRAYSPKRIENELALPLVEGAILDGIEFEHRFEQYEVEQAPPSIDPHSRLKDALLPMLNSNDRLIQTIPKKWERLDDLILFPKDAFLSDEWTLVVEKHGNFFHTVA